MSKSLFEIFEEYFYPQINIDGDGINADIERYETCYNLLQDLLSDLDDLEEHKVGKAQLTRNWENILEEYFSDCMTEYIMNSDYKSDLSDENADNYIPYNYVHCSKCGIRCYFGAYPEAIVVDDDGNCLCELCSDEMNSEGKEAEKIPKKVKIKVIRK